MLLQPAAEDIPVDPVELFGREAPLVCEIGTGSGYFIEAIAEERPATDFLAVERHSASVRRAYNRLCRAKFTNVRIYHGEGGFFLRNLVTPRQLDALYINFPDPWPKQKDVHRRLFRPDFIRLIAGRLRDDASAYLTTDHREYFEWACRRGRGSAFVSVHVQDPPAAALQSRYAQKWISKGRSIFHAAFRKITHANVSRTLELVPMQHAVLKGTPPDISQFETIVHAFDGNHVVIKRVLRPLDGEAVLFATHLEEEGLTQDILLRVRDRRDSDRWVVGVDPFGHPIATRGVAEAVRVLTDWLLEQGLTVVETSY